MYLCNLWWLMLIYILYAFLYYYIRCFFRRRKLFDKSIFIILISSKVFWFSICCILLSNRLMLHCTVMSSVNFLFVYFPCVFLCLPLLNSLSGISLIFDKCSILKQTIWQSNHASHTKLYFNEFVANVLRDNIGGVIFDLRGQK